MPTGIYKHAQGKEHYLFGRKLSEETKENKRLTIVKAKN